MQQPCFCARRLPSPWRHLHRATQRPGTFYLSWTPAQSTDENNNRGSNSSSIIRNPQQISFEVCVSPVGVC